jgi:hypothetical protein
MEAQGGAHVRVGRTDRGRHSQPGATATFRHPVPRHPACAEGFKRNLAPQGDYRTFLKEINHCCRSNHARYRVTVARVVYHSHIVTLRHKIIPEAPSQVIVFIITFHVIFNNIATFS